MTFSIEMVQGLILNIFFYFAFCIWQYDMKSIKQQNKIKKFQIQTHTHTHTRTHTHTAWLRKSNYNFYSVKEIWISLFSNGISLNSLNQWFIEPGEKLSALAHTQSGLCSVPELVQYEKWVQLLKEKWTYDTSGYPCYYISICERMFHRQYFGRNDEFCKT